MGDCLEERRTRDLERREESWGGGTLNWEMVEVGGGGARMAERKPWALEEPLSWEPYLLLVDPIIPLNSGENCYCSFLLAFLLLCSAFFRYIFIFWMFA